MRFRMDPSEWKKPSDVMKIHRRRKSVSQRRITSDPDKRTSIIYKSPSKSVKRKNPFHKDSPHPFPSKRQHIDFKENTNKDQPLSCQLFSMLDTVNEVRTTIVFSLYSQVFTTGHCCHLEETLFLVEPNIFFLEPTFLSPFTAGLTEACMALSVQGPTSCLGCDSNQDFLN